MNQQRGFWQCEEMSPPAAKERGQELMNQMRDIETRKTAQEALGFSDNYGDRRPNNRTEQLFRMIFREPEALLGLYNALNGTEYSQAEDLDIGTTEHSVYMNVKEDASFFLSTCLTLYEQPAICSPNIPLCSLMFVTDMYWLASRDKWLDSPRRILIPVPCFVVLYNGTEPMPERSYMKLSDLYERSVEPQGLELKVLVLNVNAGCNQELMNRCRLLKDYSLYVAKVREYCRTMAPKEAVELAVNTCIEEGILAEFLEKHKKEAIAVCIAEYGF